MLCLDPELASVILNAAAATGVGATYAMPQRRGGGGVIRAFSWATATAGSPSAVSVTIEGSDDGTVFSTLDTSTSTSGEVRILSNNLVSFIRANLGTLTGGTPPVTVTVTVQPGG